MTESDGGSAASGTASAVANESSSGPSTASAANIMDNMEEVLMELTKFEKRTDESAAIPQLLEEYIRLVAKTGSTFFPWPKVKPLIKAKLEAVITDFYTSHPTEDLPPVPNVDPFSFASCKSKVFQQLDYFGGIPFTVQRLCELLISPKKHYKRTDKFMRALEKNMLIVSTVDSRSKHKVEESAVEEKADDPLRPSAIRMMNGTANGEERISAASDSFKVRSGVKRRLSDDADDADDEDDDEPDAKGSKGEKQKPTAAVAASASPTKGDEDEQEPEKKAESEDRLKAEEAKGPCDSGDANVKSGPSSSPPPASSAIDGASSSSSAIEKSPASDSSSSAAQQQSPTSDKQQPSTSEEKSAEEIMDTEDAESKQPPSETTSTEMSSSSQATTSASSSSEKAEETAEEEKSKAEEEEQRMERAGPCDSGEPSAEEAVDGDAATTSADKTPVVENQPSSSDAASEDKDMEEVEEAKPSSGSGEAKPGSAAAICVSQSSTSAATVTLSSSTAASEEQKQEEPTPMEEGPCDSGDSNATDSAPSATAADNPTSEGDAAAGPETSSSDGASATADAAGSESTSSSSTSAAGATQPMESSDAEPSSSKVPQEDKEGS